MKKIQIAFDVDGTLRNNKDHYEAGNSMGATPNEDIRSLLVTLSKFKNVECHIWSSGGKEYAKSIRRVFLLQPYVKEGNCWGKDESVMSFEPDIAIDDIHEFDLGKINLICKQK